jgi:peptide/nickel transport system permease protein
VASAPVTQEDQSTPLVVVDDLSVRFPLHYGDTSILDHVSFTLAPGETLGLVGESGSGKTVLGQALLGLLPKTTRITGRINVAGVEVVGAKTKDLTRLRGGTAAPIFQDALVALNPNRTIGGHFADVWKSAHLASGVWRSAAEKALRQVALRDTGRVLGSYPFELSGGMRQRALIALSILRKPSLLVADEPTTALDRLVEDEVLATLGNLQNELDISIILISHDLEVIRRVCSRTAVLYAGQICEIGPTEEVLSRPLHRYTAGLIGGIRSLKERERPLLTIPGTVPPPQEFGAGCRFTPRCPAATEECSSDRPETKLGTLTAWCHHPLDGSGSGER